MDEKSKKIDLTSIVNVNYVDKATASSDCTYKETSVEEKEQRKRRKGEERSQRYVVGIKVGPWPRRGFLIPCSLPAPNLVFASIFYLSLG